MSDLLNKHAQEVTEDIRRSVIAELDDPQYETLHFDPEDQIIRNFHADVEEIMDECTVKQDYSHTEKVPNDPLPMNNTDDARLQVSKTITKMSIPNKVIETTSKSLEKVKVCNIETSVCKSSGSLQVQDDLCTKFKTILGSAEKSSPCLEWQLKSEDKFDDNYVKNVESYTTNYFAIHGERKELSENLSNKDKFKFVLNTRRADRVKQSPVSINIDESNEKAEQDSVGLIEKCRFLKALEPTKSRSDGQRIEILDCGSIQEIESTKRTIAEKNINVACVGESNLEHGRIEIAKFERESAQNIILVEDSFDDTIISQRKQRRFGTTDMQCSANKLDTTDFDRRNSIAFGLPMSKQSEGRQYRSKEVLKEDSSGEIIVSYSDRDENISDSAEESSTNSIKRKSDTQNKESNVKFRKRCMSFTDLETGETSESRYRVRCASAGNEKCTADVGMKSTCVNVENLETLHSFQTRKRGMDNLETASGVSLCLPKKLKHLDKFETDLMVDEDIELSDKE